jgi:hypothetical protein
MEELLLAKARYEELIAMVDADIAQAETFKNDVLYRYKGNAPLEQLVTMQSQVLRTQDYITQKFNNKVELLRNYDDLCKAIKEAE